jgi:hypothetical protein
MVRLDDAGSMEAMALQKRDGLEEVGLLFSMSTGPHPHDFGGSSIQRLVKIGRGASVSFFR